MRYLKTYESIYNHGQDRVDEIESKTEDVAYMLYDIFDKYSITDCNGHDPHTPPSYANWMFFRYGNDLDEPKDRIIINVPGELYWDVYNDIENLKSDIESQIGGVVELWGNGHEKRKQEIHPIDGRIIVRVKWMKMRDKLMLFRKTGDTGPR